jgi:uroporphyrinogen decarboxylase
MTPKEAVIAAVENRQRAYTPCFYMGTPGINTALGERFGVDGTRENAVAAALGADVMFVRPSLRKDLPGAIGGFRTAEVHAKIHQEDCHESVVVPRGPLADVEYPSEIHNVDCWPSADSFSYTNDQADLKLSQSRGVVARGNGAIFLSAVGLRGMERFMMDMALEPAMCHEILAAITAFFKEKLARFLEASGENVDIVDIGDDIAGQSGMLFSLDMWRQFIKPYVSELIDVAKSYGKKVLFFGCGGFRDVIPDMIDMRIDCAGRMQTEADGNDFGGLVRDFGTRICIWGALDAQHTLIEGTAGEASEHTRAVLEAGRNVGLVAGPTHTFTEDTPIDNIIAVYETIKGEC